MTIRSRRQQGPVGIAIVGAGYWGPNLLRNCSRFPGVDVRWMCDLDRGRAAAVVGRYSTVAVTDDIDRVLADERVEAVIVATPVASHGPLATAVLDAGRHVLVEKPLAATLDEGRRLVERAAEQGLVLMCDHTYCYTPAVREIRRLVADGTLGDIQYVDSVRINLGLIRPDADVIWDLAPHDLSILDYVLPGHLRPTGVAATGVDPVGAGRACVGYVTLPFGDDVLAHLHVNWLSPTKVRTMIIGGSDRMVVWDDLQPTQRLSVFDCGVDLAAPSEDEQCQLRIGYRTGDIVAPALPETEALQGVVAEFAAAVTDARPPATDGHAGLRVLEVLEAARASLRRAGALVPLGTTHRRAA